MTSKSNILEKLNKDIYLIAGDASPRKFYRFKDKKNQILVYCKKDKKNNLENYSKINEFLISNRIKAPKTIKKNVKKNFIIIEDLGNNLLKNVVKKNKVYHFKKIIDELVKLQKIKPKKTLPKYSMKLLQAEMNLFYEWYLPEFFTKKKIKEIQKTINNTFVKLLKKITKSNNVFVHRDFHIENLIIHNRKISFLDTQDAVIGHPAYDLMSLVDDVRVNISQSDQSKLVKYYLKKTRRIQNDFLLDFHILSVQRLLKILGIFLRLYRRDHKEKYLKYLPRTWNLLKLRLKYNELKELDLIFKKYFSKKIIEKKWK